MRNRAAKILVAFWVGLAAFVSPALATPFQISAANQLREDFTIPWAGFSSTHGQEVPNFHTFATSDGGPGAMVLTAGDNNMFIWSAGGLYTPGVLLATQNHYGFDVYLNRRVQGFGLVMEHLLTVQATYILDFYDIHGNLYHSVSRQSPGSNGEPVFIGVVDPESRIDSVSIRFNPPGGIAVSAPIVQLNQTPSQDPAQLPVAGNVVYEIHPGDSYLHEGRLLLNPTEPTVEATVDNENAFDLLAAFPALKAGDILHVQRLGYAYRGGSPNNLLAVISSQNAITSGYDFHRVPGALEAGQDYYTREIPGPIAPTPTNIPEDFLVGHSNFVVFPSNGRYLFCSLEYPDPGGAKLNLSVSHIPRNLFQDWLASFGLVGAFADPNSDLDNDGLTLVEEFAFRKNPTVGDADTKADYAVAPLVSSLSELGSRLRLTFAGRLNSPVTYQAQFSSDLVNWVTVASTGVTPLLIDSTDTTRAVFGVTDPVGGPQRFGRVIVQPVTP
jgi:hypothetical protein